MSERMDLKAAYDFMLQGILHTLQPTGHTQSAASALMLTHLGAPQSVFTHCMLSKILTVNSCYFPNNINRWHFINGSSPSVYYETRAPFVSIYYMRIT